MAIQKNQSFFKIKATALEKIEQQICRNSKEMETIYSQHAPLLFSFAPRKCFSKISRGGENLNSTAFFLIRTFPNNFTKKLKSFHFDAFFGGEKAIYAFSTLKNNELQSLSIRRCTFPDQLAKLNTKISTRGRTNGSRYRVR